MSWQFWLLVHLAIMLIAIGVAMGIRRNWAAALAPIGTIIGAILAVLPLWLMMKRASATTGFDAGNAGMFFCCTVPLFPLVGTLIGFAMGCAVDEARAPIVGHCSKCGYDLRGMPEDSKTCPECGAVVAPKVVSE